MIVIVIVCGGVLPTKSGSEICPTLVHLWWCTMSWRDGLLVVVVGVDVVDWCAFWVVYDAAGVWGAAYFVVMVVVVIIVIRLLLLFIVIIVNFIEIVHSLQILIPILRYDLLIIVRMSLLILAKRRQSITITIVINTIFTNLLRLAPLRTLLQIELIIASTIVITILFVITLFVITIIFRLDDIFVKWWCLVLWLVLLIFIVD